MKAAIIISALWALFLCPGVNARSLLHGSAGPPAPPVDVADISPLSGSVVDNVAAGTQISHLQCRLTTGAACPANVSWSLVPPIPSFIGLSTAQSDGTVFLQTTAVPGSSADGDPSFDGNTFKISASLSLSTVVAISPTSIAVPAQTAQGTAYQFSCTMNDNSSCTNRSWTYGNIPSFLTPSLNSTGIVLTTNQQPPLTVGSGSLSLSAQ